MNNEITLNASIIGVPLDLGAQNLNVSKGPEAFRQVDIKQKLESAGIAINDLGDVNVRSRDEVDPGPNPRLHYLDEILRVSEETANLVSQTLVSTQKAIVLGGDHSICLGAVAGTSDISGSIGLIYIDAHGDLNSAETTLTGNIHGMHLASLLGLGSSELQNVHGDNIKIQPDNLLHIGGSDLDSSEVELIKNHHLKAFTLLDLLTSNLSPLFRSIDELNNKVDHIWISLDLDSIDEIYAPAAGMPNKKGLSYREISAICNHIGQSQKVIGIDVVEYSPSTDVDNKTAELAIELIAAVFGKHYSWYTNYLKRNEIS